MGTGGHAAETQLAQVAVFQSPLEITVVQRVDVGGFQALYILRRAAQMIAHEFFPLHQPIGAHDLFGGHTG